MNTITIIDSLRRKEDSAYGDLYANYNQDLVSFANTYLYDRDLAKDIVQEAFVYLWENSENISINHSLKNYLYATVRNRCLNELKRLKIVDSSGLLDFMSKVNSDFYEEVDAEQNTYKVHVIKRAVKELPKKMREIVTMKYFKEYSHKEIADELNISVNTVKTQLKRAKLKMSEKLVSDTGLRIVGFLALCTTTILS